MPLLCVHSCLFVVYVCFSCYWLCTVCMFIDISLPACVYAVCVHVSVCVCVCVCVCVKEGKNA